MNNIDNEHHSPNLYVEDCALAIRRIDSLIFEGIGKTSAQVIVLDEFPDKGIIGEHVGRVLSFFRHYPADQLFPYAHIAQLQNAQECYIVWRKQLIRKVERLLQHPNHSGLGDHALRELWLLMGSGIVRRRVMYRKEWFPHAKLRDMHSMRKHADLLGADAFLELRRLELKHEGNDERPAVLDIDLTQELVGAAKNSGMSDEDAVMLVTTD